MYLMYPRGMDSALLKELGLNETQASTYQKLLRVGTATPPELAKMSGITRVNAYAVLEQLETLGLVTRTNDSKTTYQVSHPLSLSKLAHQRREASQQTEQHIQTAMPDLLAKFHEHTSQPGVQFYQGLDGIKEMYQDTLKQRDDIYLLRSPHDDALFGVKYFTDYKTTRAQCGIKTYMLNTTTDPKHWNAQTDNKYNIERTQLPKNAYTAPVEMSCYGSKLALISFGEEVIGTIIESPQIANAFRQVFSIMRSSVDTAE